MPSSQPKRNPFAIKDCTLIAIATGVRAYNLRDLRDRLQTVHPGCVYFHFWGGRLRPRFDDPEFNNDFAAWASHGLHDKQLAERLSIIDPTEYPSLEDLRQEITEVVEERLDQCEYIPWAKREERFDFIRSQIIIFDTGRQISQPEELAQVLPGMTVGSIFYHFIDARRRTVGAVDDFRNWLAGWGTKYSHLRESIADIDPYFSTLTELRSELTRLFQKHFGTSRP